MGKNVKTLTERESQLLVALTKQAGRFFSVDDARSLSSDQGQVVAILHSLHRKGWVFRIERGKYLLLSLESGTEEIFSLSPYAYLETWHNPYYLAFSTALQAHGILEQSGKTLYIATTSRGTALQMGDWTLRCIALGQNFAGWEEQTVFGYHLNISTLEKTIVDCLAFPRYAGGLLSVCRVMFYRGQRLRVCQLVEFALRQGSGSLRKRLGFLLEFYSLGTSRELDQLRQGMTAGYVSLDRLLPKRGNSISRWHVVVNVPVSKLRHLEVL